MEIQVMKILIIEDTPERFQILKSLYRDHAWIHVNTAERAIKLVRHYHFDLISLDYDLAGQKKGSEVAVAIVEGINQDTRIVVHSMNATGRDIISNIISEAIIFPVLSMTKSNERFKQLREELKKGLDFDWKIPGKFVNNKNYKSGN